MRHDVRMPLVTSFALLVGLTHLIHSECTGQDLPNCAAWVADGFCDINNNDVDNVTSSCGVACGLCAPEPCVDTDVAPTSSSSSTLSTTTTSVGSTFSTTENSHSATTTIRIIQKKNDETIIIAVSTLVAMLFIILTALIAFLVVRRRSRKLNKKGKEDEHVYEVCAGSASYAKPPDHYAARSCDVWEIAREMIIIDHSSPLGQGAFGVVFLGHMVSPNVQYPEIGLQRKEHKTVAIKTIPENASPSVKLAFMDEIALMKSIGYHERLVNLLKCVTISNPPYLVMEYCAYGDLQRFLRSKRDVPDEIEERSQSYYKNWESREVVTITPRLQLCFSLQIADAVEYLSDRGFIHRDVAARNVLVDENVSCKVADFGLCRRMEQIDYYYIGKGGRLPLKWMSPEAIAEFRFTVESDVWSFGVVVWEIFSLGSTPYANCPAAELLTRLTDGYRMEQPSNCPDQVYELILDCWDREAKYRPSFADIKRRLATILDENDVSSLQDVHYYVNA